MAGTAPFTNSNPQNALFAALPCLDGQVWATNALLVYVVQGEAQFLQEALCHHQVSSTKYRKDNVVVLDTDDGKPVLGRIKDVYILADEQCVFTIQHLLVCFHSHYHAYEIVGTGNTIVPTPDKPLSYHLHNTHTCFSPSLSTSQFVCLKQHLM